MSGCIVSRILKIYGYLLKGDDVLNRLKLKHFSIYRSISAFVLALFMMFSGTLVSYAAGSDKAEAFNRVRIQNPNIVFSDFYAVGNRTDGGHDYVFVDSAVYPSDSFFCIVEDITYVNGNQGIRGRAAYISSDGTVFYISGAFTRNIVQNSNGSWVSYTVCMDVLYNTCYGSVDIADTNIPIFLSEEGAKAFYLDGDTSGVKNPDDWDTLVFDSSVEVPLNVKVKVDYEFFKLIFDASSEWFDDPKNSSLLISWEQNPETIEAASSEGLVYKTEFHVMNTISTVVDFGLGSVTRSLSPLTFAGDVILPSSGSNFSYNITYAHFISIMKEWKEEGVLDSSFSISKKLKLPMYIYMRNVCGNKCSNWVRITISNDSVVSIDDGIFGGKSDVVVSSGYDEISGDYKPGSDSVPSDDLIVNDGHYSNYTVDVDSVAVDSFVSKVNKGFGLLGDNGIVSSLAVVFAFIPGEYFTILVAYISAAAVVGLFLLFLRR